jgi:hypothetical protein
MIAIPKGGKKAKKPSLARLKNTLDGYFSQWVRRYHSKDGYCSCVSCGTSKRWQDVDAGHWISRVHLATRFHPLNVFPQCKRCNGFLGGNYPAYSLWMFDNVGIHMMQDLQEMKNNPVKYSRSDYETMISDTKAKLQALDEERLAA